MYICKNCGNVFEELDSWTESHPYGEGYADEYWSGCPYCNSTSVDEAELCEICDEYESAEDMHDGVCDKCFQKARKDIAEAVAKLFTKSEFDRLPDEILDYFWEDIEKVYKRKEENK